MVGNRGSPWGERGGGRSKHRFRYSNSHRTPGSLTSRRTRYFERQRLRNCSAWHIQQPLPTFELGSLARLGGSVCATSHVSHQLHPSLHPVISCCGSEPVKLWRFVRLTLAQQRRVSLPLSSLRRATPTPTSLPPASTNRSRSPTVFIESRIVCCWLLSPNYEIHVGRKPFGCMETARFCAQRCCGRCYPN